MVDKAWLKLARVPGLPARRVLELLPATGGVRGFCALPSSELAALGLNPAQRAALRTPDRAALEADMRWLEGPRRRLLTIDDEDYPALLRRIPSPPLVLWLEGDAALLWQPQLAIVGSRNPTAGGIAHARDFAASLVRDGWSITSGFAAGIDITAHRAALAAGGTTIAVFGTGLDIVYPRAHAAAADEIAEKGVLVSEYPPGTPARKMHFPDRNRIISGLSLGVLVVEAALNSGSLITARLAAEQGREVFALPGSLHNPMAKGCHRLIKQGARLAESTGDITEALEPLAQQLAMDLREQLAEDDPAPANDAAAAAASSETSSSLLHDPDYAQLWEALGYDPLSQDQLIERSGLAAREVSSMLLMLELNGLVTSSPGGRFCRSDPAGPVA